MARSNLELVVLALLDEGLATPYDFRITAGLSVGSTIPALNRLEADGLITGSEAGARNSRRFAVSKKGKRCLTQEWASLLNEHPTDFDSIVRIAFLTWHFRGNDAAADYLHQAGSRMRDMSENRMNHERQLPRPTSKGSAAERFVWLRTVAEANRLKADATALKTLSVEVRTAEHNNKKKQAKSPSAR